MTSRHRFECCTNQSLEDPLAFRPRPDQLLGSNNSNSEDDEDQDTNANKIYRPPSSSANAVQRALERLVIRL